MRRRVEPSVAGSKGLPMDELARSLHRARRHRVPVPSLTETRPEMIAAGAYAQRRLVELLQADVTWPDHSYQLARQAIGLAGDGGNP